MELGDDTLEAIAHQLILRDLVALSATNKRAGLLQLFVIGARTADFREHAKGSHAQLRALIAQLPPCSARISMAERIETSMSTFRRVVSCNEEFVRLCRVAALRGLEIEPFGSAVVARSCCQTCDNVTKALSDCSVWLMDILKLVAEAESRGERLLEMVGTFTADESEQPSPPDSGLPPVVNMPPAALVEVAPAVPLAPAVPSARAAAAPVEGELVPSVEADR